MKHKPFKSIPKRILKHNTTFVEVVSDNLYSVNPIIPNKVVAVYDVVQLGKSVSPTSDSLPVSEDYYITDEELFTVLVPLINEVNDILRYKGVDHRLQLIF